MRKVAESVFGKCLLGGRGSCRAKMMGRSGDGQVGKSGKIWAHQRFALP